MCSAPSKSGRSSTTSARRSCGTCGCLDAPTLLASCGQGRSMASRCSDLRMKVWPGDLLIPYPRNARTHSDEQIAQVAASIAEFGFVNPVLVGADGVIIAGHARLLAARKLKMAEVPVIVLGHLTEAQRRALVLADNKLALNAGWDADMLRVELQDLDVNGFNLDLIGFSAEELEIILDRKSVV